MFLLLNYIDTQNQLIEVKKNSVVIATFTYDGDGRQVKSVINSATIYLVGAHYHVENGQVTKYYFAGAQRVAMRKNGTLSYMLSDHLGSTLGITNTSGTLTAGTLYKAWGETRYTLGTNPTKFKYTGQREESAIGLYFYNARWYDPVSGRFAQADTIVPAGVQGLDRYAYVNNSPLNFVDPTGHFTEDAIKKYILDHCNNKIDCYDSMLAEWQADTEWWDMLLTAQAGDTIFGTTTHDDGSTDIFAYTFGGDGEDILIGAPNEGRHQLSLAMIQAGEFKGSDGREASDITWMGFVRTDDDGTPSFYIRPGYTFAQSETPEWQRIGMQGSADVIAAVLLSKIPKIGTALGFGSPFLDAAGKGAGTLVVDYLDMQNGDVQVHISGPEGSIYFNYQQYGDGWKLENPIPEGRR